MWKLSLRNRPFLCSFDSSRYRFIPINWAPKKPCNNCERQTNVNKHLVFLADYCFFVPINLILSCGCSNSMQKHSHCIPVSEVTSRSFDYFTKGTNVEPALGQTAGNTGLTSDISLNYTQMRLHKTECSILVGYVLSFVSTI